VVYFIIYCPSLSATVMVAPSLHVCKSSRIFVAFCGERAFSGRMGTIPMRPTIQSPILVAGVVIVVVVSDSTITVVAGNVSTVATSSAIITTASARVPVSIAVATALSTPIIISVVVIVFIVVVIVVLIIIPIVIVVIMKIVILAPVASMMTVFTVRVSIICRILSRELRTYTLHCLHHCRH